MSAFSGRPPDGTAGFVHVDMDAFFVSVELLRHPELRREPVVVGGTGPRGVVAAASYVARSFGIHSAMPTSQARRLCPHAVFLPGDHARYADVSTRVMALFGDLTPYVEPLSLDEAFLDVRGAVDHIADVPALADGLRRRVWEQESLTCSVGVATSKFLAKLATERAKPRPSRDGPVFGPGVHTVAAGEELAFLHPLPVRALWGVGAKTADKLARMGIETIGDLAAQPEVRLVSVLGQASGRHLHRLSRGIDDRPVVVDQAPKSIGHEETFARDLADGSELRRELVRLTDAVASRLRAAGVAGRTVTVKVRLADFRTLTRSQTTSEPIDGGHRLHEAASMLLDRFDTEPGVRLLGVSVGHLAEPLARQLRLDDALDPGWREADDVVEAIRTRFGSDAIGPAVLSRPGEGVDRFERGQQQWGPDHPDAGE